VTGLANPKIAVFFSSLLLVALGARLALEPR
jgi:threonine/homoserine/homoserine lactone efflux protein